MAKIIEFYVPERFQKTVRWVPERQRGTVIEFPLSMTRVSLERARLGREALTIGRYQRSTVAGQSKELF